MYEIDLKLYILINNHIFQTVKNPIFSISHLQDSQVDMEFLFETLNIKEFKFEKSEGSLIMHPTESNGILFTTTNEPIIDTWCELAMGKNY